MITLENMPMQPTELVAIMAAIIYSSRRDEESGQAETRQAAVEDAWQLWHLTMDEWSDPGSRPLHEHPPAH